MLHSSNQLLILVWLAGCFNLGIAIAYFTIPYFLHRFLKGMKLPKSIQTILGDFVIFILSCGVGHSFHLLVPIFPDLVFLSVAVDGITFYVSSRTALKLPKLIPIIQNFIREKVEGERLLRESEERFHNFSDNSPAVQFIKSVDGIHFWMNEAGYELFGDIVGKHPSEWLDSEVLAATRENDLQVWESNSPITVREMVPSKDGVERWWKVVKFPLRSGQYFTQSQDQRFVGGIAIEETIQVLAEQRLIDHAAKLEQLNEALQHFVYFASHDLRAPLRSIVGFAGRLKTSLSNPSPDEKTPNPKQERYLKNILDAGAWMQELIDDLLDYSRASRDESPLVPINVVDVVNSAIANLNSIIQTSRAQIIVDLPSPIVVQGSVHQLTQVFQNLLSNAIKFVPPERYPEIRISAQQEGDRWLISVADNGIGIEARFKEKIFRLFERLHDRTAYEGTGLGLAICRKILDRHNATIDVDSVLGRGTMFTISICSNNNEQRTSDVAAHSAS